MSDSDKSFISELKRQGAIILITYGVMLIITLVAFYFRTEERLKTYDHRQEMLTSKTHEIEKRIDFLNEKKIEKADYIREIDEMKQLLKEMRNDIREIKR